MCVTFQEPVNEMIFPHHSDYIWVRCCDGILWLNSEKLALNLQCYHQYQYKELSNFPIAILYKGNVINVT